MTPCDVLIIGGGIVGAGVAREAATRGLRTLLVEQADFASGTSSRSSRLLHGGLRYLAQWRFGLVRQASLEKMTLHRIAPHLCQPLSFVFPMRRGTGYPRWQLSLGLWLYDWLGGGNLGRSVTLGVPAVLQALPGLRPDGLTGATRNYDALTCDARLVLDTLRSAHAAGAEVRNYTAFVAAAPHASGWVCTLRDQEGATREVPAAAVVNAAGPWAGGFPQSGVRLRLTKGVHVVVPRDRLPVTEAVILTEGERILFVIPWGERLILGTTDTDYTGDPAAVRTEPEDVAYILGVVNEAFPGVRFTSGDVLSDWAGLRPLIASGGKETGNPSNVSRSHLLAMPRPGWFDLAGGKLTTYRLMGEEAVNAVGRHLKRRLPPSRTAHDPLAHGPTSGVLPPPVSAEVVTECCRNEWAVHLDDVMLRRTSWHFYHADRAAIAERVAGWMAEALRWDTARRAAEVERYRAT